MKVDPVTKFIIAARRGGYTYRRIGLFLGISPPGVRYYIVKRARELQL